MYMVIKIVLGQRLLVFDVFVKYMEPVGLAVDSDTSELHLYI